MQPKKNDCTEKNLHTFIDKAEFVSFNAAQPSATLSGCPSFVFICSAVGDSITNLTHCGHASLVIRFAHSSASPRFARRTLAPCGRSRPAHPPKNGKSSSYEKLFFSANIFGLNYFCLFNGFYRPLAALKHSYNLRQESLDSRYNAVEHLVHGDTSFWYFLIDDLIIEEHICCGTPLSSRQSC